MPTGAIRVSHPARTAFNHARVLPDFWLRVGWLWQRPLPDPTRALLEIDRDAYGQYLRDQLRQAGVQP
jgi:hypothetical protein